MTSGWFYHSEDEWIVFVHNQQWTENGGHSRVACIVFFCFFFLLLRNLSVLVGNNRTTVFGGKRWRNLCFLKADENTTQVKGQESYGWVVITHVQYMWRFETTSHTSWYSINQWGPDYTHDWLIELANHGHGLLAQSDNAQQIELIKPDVEMSAIMFGLGCTERQCMSLLWRLAGITVRLNYKRCRNCDAAGHLGQGGALSRLHVSNIWDVEGALATEHHNIFERGWAL